MRLGVAFLLAGFLVAAAVTVVSEDAVPTATISASPPLPEVPSYPEFKNEILAKQPKVDHVDDEDATTVSASSSSISTTGKPVTLSDRINFASHSLGASIFAANSEAKGASSLLTSDPDGYYMSPCSAKKWVVIGLPEEILIDTVVLSNMERYSSPVHNFVLYGSKSGPNGDMDTLASFNASKTLGEQTFHLNPPGWARYVKLSMKTHHGSEFYCTLTSIKIYGKTVIEALQTNVDKLEQVNDGTGMNGNSGHVGLGAIEEEPELAALARTLLAVPDAADSPVLSVATPSSRTTTASPTAAMSAPTGLNTPTSEAAKLSSEVPPAAASLPPAEAVDSVESADVAVSNPPLLSSVAAVNVSKPVTAGAIELEPETATVSSTAQTLQPSPPTEAVNVTTAQSVAESSPAAVPAPLHPTPTASEGPTSPANAPSDAAPTEATISSSAVTLPPDTLPTTSTSETKEIPSGSASTSASAPVIVVTADSDVVGAPLLVSASMVPSLLVNSSGERSKDPQNMTTNVLVDDGELYCGLDEEFQNESALELASVGNPAPSHHVTTNLGRMQPLPTYSVIPMTGSSSMINIITKKLHELTLEQNVIRQYITEFQQLFNLISARMESSIEANRLDITALKTAVSPVPVPTALVRLPTCSGEDCGPADVSIVPPTSSQAYSMLHQDLQALRHDMVMMRHQYGAVVEDLSLWRWIATISLVLMVLVAAIAYKIATRAVLR